MIPICFINKKKLIIVRDIIESIFISWYEDWCYGKNTISISDFFVSSEFGDDRCLYAGSKTESFIAINGSYSLWHDLVFSNDTNKKESEDDLTIHVLKSAQLSLMQRLSERLGLCENIEIQDEVCETDRSVAEYIPGDRFVSLNVSIGTIVLNVSFAVKRKSLFFDDSTVKNISDLAPMKINTVSSLPVDVNIELDLGEFSVEMINHMRVGDVIATNVNLQTPFGVSLNGKLLAHAFLGKVGNVKAVSLQTSKQK